MNTMLKIIFAVAILFTLNISANSQNWCTCVNCGGSGWLNEDVACNGCGGSGEFSCALCSGSGNENCPACDGSGTVTSNVDGTEIECPNCHGSKTVTCGACEGRGAATCLRCGGGGRIVEQTECPACGRTGLVECEE